MSVDHQALRSRFLEAPVVAPPAPWRPAAQHVRAVGGLHGVGFVSDPGTGADLLLVASVNGRGLIDAATGERVARDDEDWDLDADLRCIGIGPVEGVPVRVAGLFGGGLHTVTRDGWTVHVMRPDWPAGRVVLARGHGPWTGEAGVTWWHVHHAYVTELRAAGFSPSGASLVVATSSDVTLWTREV